MTALYLLTGEYKVAAQRLADLDLDETTVRDTLDGLSGELEEKATNVAFVVRNLEATAEAIKAAEAEMAQRRKALENRAALLKSRIQGAMQAIGMQKIACPYFTVTVRDNPPSVEVYEPGLVPAQFMRQPEPPPPAPDKTAIKAAIKAGEEVPGCRVTVGKRLEIK
jgi:hypothetical protein